MCLRLLVTNRLRLVLTLALVRRRGGIIESGKPRSMPLNASNRLFQLFHTVLLARFRAARNPLRIPKVLRKAARDRVQPCPKYSSIYCFIDVFPGYPG